MKYNFKSMKELKQFMLDNWSWLSSIVVGVSTWFGGQKFQKMKETTLELENERTVRELEKQLVLDSKKYIDRVREEVKEQIEEVKQTAKIQVDELKELVKGLENIIDSKDSIIDQQQIIINRQQKQLELCQKTCKIDLP